MSRRQVYRYITRDELVISFLVIGQITRNTIIYSSKMSLIFENYPTIRTSLHFYSGIRL